MLENVTPFNLDSSSISEQDRSLILQHNRLDQELYDFCKDLLLERIEQQGRSFAAELDECKASDNVSNMWVSARHSW